MEFEGYNKILLKHMLADARNCKLAWKADFTRMEIDLQVDVISPLLLVDFIEYLPRCDERFLQTGLTDAVEITRRFNVTLNVHAKDGKASYRLHAYRSPMPGRDPRQVEIELLPIAEVRPVQSG